MQYAAAARAAHSVCAARAVRGTAAASRVALGRAQRIVDELSQRKRQRVVALRRKVLIIARHGQRLGVGVEADALLGVGRRRAVSERGASCGFCC